MIYKSLDEHIGTQNMSPNVIHYNSETLFLWLMWQEEKLLPTGMNCILTYYKPLLELSSVLEDSWSIMGMQHFFWIPERNTCNQFHYVFGSTIGHLKWGSQHCKGNWFNFNRNRFTFIKLLHNQWTAINLFFSPLIITNPNYSNILQ